VPLWGGSGPPSFLPTTGLSPQLCPRRGTQEGRTPGVGKKGGCSARQRQVTRGCGPARGALGHVQKPVNTYTSAPFRFKGNASSSSLPHSSSSRDNTEGAQAALAPGSSCGTPVRGAYLGRVCTPEPGRLYCLLGKHPSRSLSVRLDIKGTSWRTGSKLESLPRRGSDGCAASGNVNNLPSEWCVGDEGSYLPLFQNWTKSL